MASSAGCRTCRCRDNLFASASRAPFPPRPGQERVIHVNLADAAAAIAAMDAEEEGQEGAPVLTAAAAFHAADAPGLTGGAALPAARAAAPLRSSWRQQQPPLRAPAPAAGLRPPAALPLLPSGPSPVSPVALQRAAPACPVPAPRAGGGQERCLPDAGSFLGASFRAGWGPDAVLAFAGVPLAGGLAAAFPSPGRLQGCSAVCSSGVCKTHAAGSLLAGSPSLGEVCFTCHCPSRQVGTP